MQVLRAVLRFHGIQIADNPLAPTTAGAKRIHIAPSQGDPTPIPAKRLGVWRAAALAQKGDAAAQLRCMLLAGARPGELPQLKARDVDMDDGCFTLLDTKNRSDHTVMISKQVRAIFEARVEGKKPDDLVFPIQDLRVVLKKVNEIAVTPQITPHCLRHPEGPCPAGPFGQGRLREHTMSNLSAIHAAALPSQLQDVADFIAQHGRPDRPPTLYASLQSLKTIDTTVYDYCGKIEALMQAMRAIIDSAPESEVSDTLRHLARLAEQRATLCREEVSSAVEDAGLESLDEGTAVICPRHEPPHRSGLSLSGSM